MEWPYDPDGEKGSEGGRKYGHAILAEKVDEDEDFPLSKSEFVSEHADEPVRIDYETVVSVEEIFEYVDADEFDDILHFHRELGAGMREGGYWFYELA